MVAVPSPRYGALLIADLIAATAPAVAQVVCPDIGSGGSGFFVNPHGLLVTSNHVIAQAQLSGGALAFDYSSDIRVLFGASTYRASTITEPNDDRPIVYDYAILQLPGLVGNPWLDVADLSTVGTGDEVVCLGYPLDFNDLIATNGIVSAIVRRPSHINSLHYLRSIVSNALIQFGNSGGPMVHVPSGKVIGINTLKHPFPEQDTRRLRELLGHDSTEHVPGMRDLLTFVLKYAYVGLNHAVSIEYVVGDPNWPNEEAG